MTKINIISGFLGAGKTTFIKRLLADVFVGEKLVLIENEFGEIGVDGGFLQDAGVEITEINSGCICCSLVGDFTEALKKTVQTYHPDRILIEPSGVGKLSDVIAAVQKTGEADVDACITVADASKCKMYRKNFGEFYEDQILHANSILLTRTDKASEAKIEQAIGIIREINPDANIVTTPLALLDREQILDAMMPNEMEKELWEHHHEHDEHCDCHEHHHEHDEHCDCHEHHHEHGEHCDCHEHHHEHDKHCDCHEHHHEHDEHCDCHEHHHEHGEHCDCHEHHHHHHAEETFSSWGTQTIKTYSTDEIETILCALDSGDYGTILRAKGMVAAENDWIYFDYVPGEHEIRVGKPCFTGKICVIGAALCEEKLESLFSKKN